MAQYDYDEWKEALDRLIELSDWLVEHTNVTYKECFYKIADIVGPEHFGVEYICLDNFEDIHTYDYLPEAYYLNMGDTYSTTLILTDDELNGVQLYAWSWGGWYEEIEQHYCEKENVLRCSNCSHFTPFEYGKEDINECVCEYCECTYQ